MYVSFLLFQSLLVLSCSYLSCDRNCYHFYFEFEFFLVGIGSCGLCFHSLYNTIKIIIAPFLDLSVSLVFVTTFYVHRAEYDLFQIELSKNYGVAEWREDIKGCMKKAGLENKAIVFLFSDTQVPRYLQSYCNVYTACANETCLTRFPTCSINVRQVRA